MITDRDIETVFGSILERIGDTELRGKVVKAWVLACQRGGWTSLDDLRAMPFTLLTNTRGVNFIEHTIAVTEGACGLAKAQEAACSDLPYKIDYDRLLAGGLLHDVGKLLEFERDEQGNFRKSRSGMCAASHIGHGRGLRGRLVERGAEHDCLSCQGGRRSPAGGRDRADSPGGLRYVQPASDDGKRPVDPVAKSCQLSAVSRKP